MSESVQLGFEPKIKTRHRSHSRVETQLLPNVENEKWSAVFTGFAVEMTNSAENNIRSLYENGCFGKGSHSRSFPLSCGQNTKEGTSSSFDEILVLDLEEAFYLAYFLAALTIVDSKNVPLDREQAFKAFHVLKPNFVYSLAAYMYFKSKGWIVKSGMKFGGDFLLYKQSPRLYHASFIAIVLPEEKNLEAKDLQGLHRIAETSDKDLILLNVYAPSDVPPAEHYNYIQSFKVTEMIPRRFDFKKHVQSK